MFGFFLERHDPAVSIDLRDAVPGGIRDPDAENMAAGSMGCGIHQNSGEAATMEQVVAKNQRHGLTANEAVPDQERLGKAARRILDGVADVAPELAAIAKQPFIGGQIMRCRDHKDFRMPASISVEIG